MSKKLKTDSKPKLDEYTESLQQCGNEINDALHAYFKRERINFAALTGMLEHTKIHVIAYGDRMVGMDMKFDDGKPPKYVGWLR